MTVNTLRRDRDASSWWLRKLVGLRASRTTVGYWSSEGCAAGVPRKGGPDTMRAMVTSEHLLQVEWRSAVTDEELVDLTRSHGGAAEAGWWDRVRSHSLGWVTARTEAGELVGFVNVAWDGGDHAFLIDTKTRPTHQRQGLGVVVVRRAIAEAQAAGCEWLFVDFEPALTAFYIRACGFRSTPAGLVHVPSWTSATA